MVKKNFAGLTKEEFIENKSVQNNNMPYTKKRIIDKNVKMIRQTLYLPDEINKILWHHRIDTGKSISLIVTEMTQKYIKHAQ